jgi:uncharacterized RDD family membrane protein YckC
MTNRTGGRDTPLAVQTPEGVEFMLYPAGLPIRACAFAIDETIQVVFVILVSILSDLAGIGMWQGFLILFCIKWFYFTAWEIWAKGQSPGKRIMGIRVVQSDGSLVAPGASFVRNLLRFADAFLYLYWIGAFCIAASPGFRRLGDWTADTLVVYTSHASAPRGRDPKPWITEFEPVNPPVPLSFEEKQAVLMFARRYPLLGPARGDEIVRNYAAKLRGPGDNPARYILGIARTIGGDGL